MKKKSFDYDKIMQYKKSGIVILILFAALVWLGIDIANKIQESRYIGQDVSYRNTISVQATGEVYANPDLALTTASVITEAKDVDEALSENTEKMNAVISFLKEQGIEDKDLKTTGFNIYPRYEYHERTEDRPSGERVLVGYEVNQSLEIKIRDLESIGAIIQGVTENGANNVSGLSFTIENQDELKEQSRGEAIEEAKAKAEKLASQLGVKLAKITNFSESSVYPRYYDFSKAASEEMDAGGAVPSVEPGENKIEVTVNLTYEIY
jgi:uncharacterized protein